MKLTATQRRKAQAALDAKLDAARTVRSAEDGRRLIARAQLAAAGDTIARIVRETATRAALTRARTERERAAVLREANDRDLIRRNVEAGK